MCIHLRPYGWRHTYNTRCELNFILCVRAVQSLLSGMERVHAFFDMRGQPVMTDTAPSRKYCHNAVTEADTQRNDAKDRKPKRLLGKKIA